MAIKIKSNLNLKKQIQGAQSTSSKKIKKEIVGMILEEYNKGLSPVKGFNKFKNYRPSTAKKKGRKSPVTLKDTGDLHKSLKATQKSKKTIELTFKGSKNQKKAVYHQFGTDNMDARPLLPSSGQVFKQKIINKIKNIVDKALK